jgi:FAD binding domain
MAETSDTVTFDVVVVGSGAGGLTAAVVAAQSGLKVLVVEKADVFGGTTAYSSGGAWIPNNPYMPSVDQHDSDEEAHTYLRATLGNQYDAAMVGAFVESGPEMLRYMGTNTHVRFYPVLLTDYAPDAPGAKLARTIIATEFDGRALGSLIRHVRNPLPGYVAFGSFQSDAQHVGKLTAAFKTREGFLFSARRMAGFLRDLIVRGKGTHMAHGNALIGRLLCSALDAKVTLWRSAPAIRLVKENGAVTGVVISRNGKEQTILARRGVVLASGGFGANAELRAKYIPQPEVHLSAQPKENVGDGIRIGEGAGGVLAEPNAANGIWAPCSAHRNSKGEILSVFPHFGPDRGKPGSLIVGMDGKRFANEAAPYQNFVNIMNEQGIGSAWFIAHKTALRKYGMGVAMPAPLPYRHLVRDGYLIEAPTIAALAAKIHVPVDVLEQTVATFNTHAARGEDSDFNRGGNIYDNAQGDFGHTPNPNLGALTDAPYYAVEIHPGDCSSILGLNTNIDAQVLDEHKSPIPGLYAVGLDQNSMMFGHYPGGGSSIGPAMTFAFRAARHLASA